jgi:hypothetical protein
MTFDKPTTGQPRTASREASVDASLGGDRLRADPINGPGSETAGRDRRCLAPDLPHVGETWRNRRTGDVATVRYREGDFLYESSSGFAWPIDLFVQRWERAA